MSIEVKTRLTLDEKDALRGLNRSEAAFARVAGQAQKAGSSMLKFARDTASTALGVHFPSMVRGAYGMAKSFFDVAEAAKASTKSFTGLYGMFRDIPFEEAASEARKMREELTDMAVEIGEKPADAYATFQTLARAMGADTAKEMGVARQQTEQLMVLADALGMQVGDLAGEFAMFSKAPRIMRGPMFDILRATGVFGKDLVTMNKNWTKLSESAKQRGLAQALEIQSAKLRSVPETWEDHLDRINEVLRQGKEAIGTPVLEAMMPVATEFVAEMKRAMPDLKAGGIAIGQQAAKYLVKAFEMAKSAFSWAQKHSGEIKAAISSAADKLKAAFDAAWKVAKFIYDNKELIAGALVGTKVAQGVSGVGDAAGSLAKGLGATGEAATGFAGFGKLLAQLGNGSVVAGAGALAAAAAAVAAVGAAGYNAVKLAEELSHGDSAAADAEAQLETAQKHINANRLEEARLMIEQAKASHEKSWMGLGGKGIYKTQKSLEDRQNQLSQIDSMYSGAVDRFGNVINESSKRTQNLVSELVDTWNAASQLNDTAMQQSVANILLNSQASRDVLISSGLAIAGGIGKMDELVVNAYRQFLADIGGGGEIGGPGAGGAGEGANRERRKAMRTAMKKGAAAGAGVEVNMSGGQTFHIKQDFRDQDPDRIAVVFQRDIVRAAVNRRASKMTSVFGVL